MDESRIEQLRKEVLGQLDASRPAQEASGLESRVAALEAAVSALLGGGRVAPPGIGGGGPAAHPSLQLLAVGGGTDRCVMEPDKPCVQSHACRVLGH